MNRRFPLFVAALLLAAGCGYSFGTQVPEDVRKVRLDMAGRWPLRARGMEFELTEAVKKEIHRRTPCRLVRGGEDARLEIEILKYSAGTVSSLVNQVTDANLRVTVKVKFLKSGAGEENVLFDGEVTETEAYSPSSGDTEAEARNRTVAKLARKITDCMQQWN